ncbi:MAG TPA: DUF2793 domain-containing protein [Rhizomicrobium sp.]
MSGNTPRLALGEMIDGAEMDPMAVNAALEQIDAFTDICLLGQFVNTPPASPVDGDMYLVGGAPTGDWTGKAYKIVYRIAGAWRAYVPFNGLRAFVATTKAYLVYLNGQWIDANALISASEVSIASAATCDLGAAGSLSVCITGATTITGFGAGASLLRFVRFAQALTLTHNAASLILPGAANIVTAAGDMAVFESDSAGHWRCIGYQRAHGGAPIFTGVTGSGKDVGSASPVLSGNVIIQATGNETDETDSTFNIGSSAVNAMQLYMGINNTNGYSYIGSVFSHVSYRPLCLCPNGGAVLIGYTASNGAYMLQVNSQIFATSSTIATSHGPYKDNQQPLTGCLGIVNMLQPKSFTWKQGAGAGGVANPNFGHVRSVQKRDDLGNAVVGEDGQPVMEDIPDTREWLREPHAFPAGTQVGFIAQDVQAALAGTPFLDAIVKSNTREAPKDAGGNSVGAEETFLGIAEGNLIAILTGAVKELSAQVAALNARVAVLETAGH